MSHPRILTWLSCGLLALSVSSAPVGAQEEDTDTAEAARDPATLDTGSPYWIVGFDAKKLRMVSPAAGTGAGQVYWYLVYTLENRYDTDREVFVGGITATVDGKKKYADIFLPSVERAAEKRERRELWGRVDQYKQMAAQKPSDPKYGYTTLKAGEKRQCLAVFNRIDPNVTRVIIEVAGLSNEIQVKTDEDGGKVLVERVRQFAYERAGDEFGITRDSFKFKGKKWIKREVPMARKE